MSAVEGKYELELNYPGDGRIFLNYWDYMHGNDVIAELIEGKLFMDMDTTGKKEEVSFFEYINKVEESIKLRL